MFNEEERRARTPVYEELLSYLPKEWDADDYVLCGSACLAERGIRDVGDLDVQIKPKLWPEVLRLHEAGHFPEGPDKQVQPGPDSDFGGRDGRALLTSRIDFFVDIPRIFTLGADEVFAKSELRRGRRIISLRHCLAIKALVPESRRKDVNDMISLAFQISEEECRRNTSTRC